jgi:hypothetical protein
VSERVLVHSTRLAAATIPLQKSMAWIKNVLTVWVRKEMLKVIKPSELGAEQRKERCRLINQVNFKGSEFASIHTVLQVLSAVKEGKIEKKSRQKYMWVSERARSKNDQKGR